MKKITLINSSELLPTQMDIYSGEETIRFNNRHPIYKTLMKLEFEDILRSFLRK
jgi:hypothetical protein